MAASMSGAEGGQSSSTPAGPRSPGIDPFVVILGIFTIALTTAPYVIGAANAHGRTFTWCLDNTNDYSAYLAYMQQGVAGKLFAPSMFAIGSRPMLVISPFYFALGRLCALFHISLIAGFQIARVLFDAALIAVVWILVRRTVSDTATRRAAMLMVCLSAGLGWTAGSNPVGAPIDRWQSEAFLFLSAMSFPHFAFAESLQISVLLLLLSAERTGKIRYAVAAGAIGFLIAVNHTYDCVSLAAVWTAYLAVCAFVRKEPVGRTLALTLVAALVTAPGIGFMLYQLKTNPDFAAQTSAAADSGPLSQVIFGYGLPLVLAIVGAVYACSSDKSSGRSNAWAPAIERKSGLFLTVWMAANLIVSYAPVWAQRKLIQGSQFPIDILAGVGLIWLVSRSRIQLKPAYVTAICLLATLITMPTNIMVMQESLGLLQRDRDGYGMGRMYLEPGETQALEWVKEHASAGAPIQALPGVTFYANGNLVASDTTLAFFAPALTGHCEYYGNIWESPHPKDRLFNLTIFPLTSMTDDKRIEFLSRTGIQYIIVPISNQPVYPSIFAPGYPTPSYLHRMYANSDDAVFQVVLPS